MSVFWNVEIDIFIDGTIKAAVLGSQARARKPHSTYQKNQWREVRSLWFHSEAEAQEAVAKAKTMNKKEVAA